MNIKKTFIVFVILSLLVNTVVFPFVNIGSSLAASLPVVDDFEAPLNYGLDANNIQIGFFAAQDGASGPTTFARTTTPPTPVPGSAAGNNVLQMNFAVSVWAVVIHGFENEEINQWISQDWSAYEGISFWLYGQGDGSSLFIDVIDNRNTPPAPMMMPNAIRSPLRIMYLAGSRSRSLLPASPARRSAMALRTMALPCLRFTVGLLGSPPQAHMFIM